MNCLNCNVDNSKESPFCSNCGMDLKLNSALFQKVATSDMLLIVFIGITFLSAVFQFAIRQLLVNWDEGPFRYVMGFMWIFGNLGFMLIPLTIKNRVIRLLGLLITGILVSYWIYVNILFIAKF